MKNRWFKFYPDEWLASPVVQTMTPEEEVTYLRLLLFDWMGDGLTADLDRLAMLSRTSSTVVATVVQRAFNEHPEHPEKITNLRLHELRKEAQKQQAQRVNAGRKSAEVRRLNRTNKRNGNERSTSVQRAFNEKLSSRSTNKEQEQEEKESTKEKARARKSSLPDNWKPDKPELAPENGMDFDAAFEYFRNWAISNGRTYVNWNLTWQNACKDWLQRCNIKRPASTPKAKSASKRIVAEGKEEEFAAYIAKHHTHLVGRTDLPESYHEAFYDEDTHNRLTRVPA
tara:strand:+ start:318 stop:1169 length:852 start_codon:yes stop_codon:yes gene_type:complete